MKEIQERLKKAYNLLITLDCTNYKQKEENQKKVSEAFREIEKALKIIDK